MSADQLSTELKERKTSPRSGTLVISENPELFGGLSNGFQFVKEKHHLQYIRMAIIGLGILASIPLLIIAYRAYLEFFGEGNGRLILDIVKILFIYGAILSIVTLCAIPFFYKQLKDLLIDIEEVALFGRDFALFNLPIYRQQLIQLNEKLKGSAEKDDLANGFDLIKHLIPVAKLFMAKEKNLFKWGMSGFKMLKNLKSFVEGQSK